jgi:hypothetical protein
VRRVGVDVDVPVFVDHGQALLAPLPPQLAQRVELIGKQALQPDGRGDHAVDRLARLVAVERAFQHVHGDVVRGDHLRREQRLERVRRRDLAHDFYGDVHLRRDVLLRRLQHADQGTEGEHLGLGCLHPGRLVPAVSRQNQLGRFGHRQRGVRRARGGSDGGRAELRADRGRDRPEQRRVGRRWPATGRLSAGHWSAARGQRGCCPVRTRTPRVAA